MAHENSAVAGIATVGLPNPHSSSKMAASQRHPRLILRSFLSLDLCKELEFIHKSCCAVGYRPNVFSTTLSHLVATNSAHLILPFVPIREKLKEKVEEYFGCEYELVVEFTGLISWCKGASIGWHSDDNRDYLRQRDFAAVCYLNSYGVDFEGGLFHFQDGEPSTIAPMSGDVILYTADNRNIHSVDEITKGERITLTLWFSRDASHDEDTRVLKSLTEHSEYSNLESSNSCLPVQASNNMYWFPPEEASRFMSGFDIRCARLHVLGFDIFSSVENSLSLLNSSYNPLNLLNMPLRLAFGEKSMLQDFASVLHALQVVQFQYWKALDVKKLELKGLSVNFTPLSESQQQKIDCLKVVILKDLKLADTLFGCAAGDECVQWSFDAISFSAAVSEWEDYTIKLRKELAMSLQTWITHQSIFPIENHG